MLYFIVVLPPLRGFTSFTPASPRIKRKIGPSGCRHLRNQNIPPSTTCQLFPVFGNPISLSLRVHFSAQPLKHDIHFRSCTQDHAGKLSRIRYEVVLNWLYETNGSQQIFFQGQEIIPMQRPLIPECSRICHLSVLLSPAPPPLERQQHSCAPLINLRTQAIPISQISALLPTAGLLEPCLTTVQNSIRARTEARRARYHSVSNSRDQVMLKSGKSTAPVRPDRLPGLAPLFYAAIAHQRALKTLLYSVNRAIYMCISPD